MRGECGMAAIELRECTPADVDAVLLLWQRADAVPRPTDRPDALLKRIAYGDSLFLVATADERIVGSLIGGWDGWRGGLYRLAIDPEFRRRGIATRLVREVEARLRVAGAERVPIRVFHGEPGAVEFWRSLGYEPEPDEAIFAKNL
jgi:ribosomal protein S18 acetylase RimI-like enzyme